jgi:hypothetical protein
MTRLDRSGDFVKCDKPVLHVSKKQGRFERPINDWLEVAGIVGGGLWYADLGDEVVFYRSAAG